MRCRIPLYLDQARLRCAPPRGALRAALWLEAPLARARQLDAVTGLVKWLIPASRLSGVDRNPSRALRVADAMACGHPRQNPAESRRVWQLSGISPRWEGPLCYLDGPPVYRRWGSVARQGSFASPGRA
jgi:hypothetical protein